MLAFQLLPTEIHNHIALMYTRVKCEVHHMYTEIFCALWVFNSAQYSE